MKRRTPLSTLVGAVPGALPALIGWTASHGSIERGGAALFAIVFLWQIPHFMAIAWLYRDDYGKAGFPMLPVIDPEGRRAGRQAVYWALPAGARQPRAVFSGLAGDRLSGRRDRARRRAVRARGPVPRARNEDHRARAVLGSITYLPLLWIAMIADTSTVTVPRSACRQREPQRAVRRPAAVRLRADPSAADRAAPP